MSKLPAIVVKNNNACPPSTAKKLPGIKVNNACASECNDNADAASMEATDSYPYTGYYSRLLTYTYEEIDRFEYPLTYWVIVDNNMELIGENIADQDALLVALNAMGLGTWTVDGAELTVVGYHQYGLIISGNAINMDSLTLTIATDAPVDLLNIWGSTWFDLSIENSLVGNAALIGDVAALNFSFLAFPTGAVINWWHPAGSDGWGSVEADATDRGLDYTTVQGGDLYNGGVPYGRKFLDEYKYFIDQLGISRSVMGLNISHVLIPFSGTTINWATVDYQAVKDEVDLIISEMATTGAVIWILELGMELKTGAWEDLFVNTGGAETTKAQILERLLTEVDAGTSILQYIRNELPNVVIEIDGRLWDDGGNDDSDWNRVLLALDLVDVGRQYYQFKDSGAVTYEAARERIAARTDFWAVVEDSDFAGKGVFLSQVTVKATSPIRNTAANGLLMAEIYLELTRDNLDHNDKLIGACFMNIKQLFDVNDDYAPKVHYPFMVQLGSFFADNQKLVPAVGNGAAITNNLIVLATKVGSEIRVAIVNPTAEDITIDALIIDGISVPSSNLVVTQNYSTNATDPLTEGVTGVTQDNLRIRPWSLSIAKTTPDVSGVTVDTMQPMFGVALDNVGNYYTSLYSKTDFTDLCVEIGFQHGIYSSGAQDRWIHYVSKRGGFSLLPNNEPLSTVSNVGMRANTNEIYFYAGMADDSETEEVEFAAPVNLHEDYNATGQDFWARFKTYCDTVANMSMVVFTANISHGTTTELGQYLTELETLGIPYKVRYGNEMSTGSSDAVTPETSMTSAEYIALVVTFDNYVKANFPNAVRVINIARVDRAGWVNADVVACAIDQGIEEFSQYFWLGDNAGGSPSPITTNDIDDYFATALNYTRDILIDSNNSLYGECLPRLQDYYDMAYPLRMHVGQFGCSLQRTGYVAHTMLHGLMIFNQYFEFWKFNYTHDNFIDSAVMLMNETAVSVMTGQDALFSIDPSYLNGAGSDTFVKRIQGVAIELMKPLSTWAGGYPEFIPVTITNQPAQFDIVAFKVDSLVYLWIYNIQDAAVIQSISIDGDTLLTDVDVTGCYSTKLYGSIGSSPAYNYFKDFPIDSPDLEPTDIVPISELSTSSSLIDIPEHSIIKIKLTGVTTASAIIVNINPPA